MVDYINDYQELDKDELKQRVFESYKENMNYFFNDFLKIRELKIINSALILNEINLNNVIEAEKLLYENLVSSIKGYKKVKAFSLYEKDQALLDKPIEIRTEKSSKLPDSTIKADQEKIIYTLVRFLKNTPPLVGVDLINYGPFEKEDIVNLPQKNAKILIVEKFAEKIEVP